MERDVILGEGGRFACTAATPWIGAVLRKTCLVYTSDAADE